MRLGAAENTEERDEGNLRIGLSEGGGKMAVYGVIRRGCPGPEGFERHKELQLPEDYPPAAHPAFITGLIKLTRQPVM